MRADHSTLDSPTGSVCNRSQQGVRQNITVDRGAITHCQQRAYSILPNFAHQVNTEEIMLITRNSLRKGYQHMTVKIQSRSHHPNPFEPKMTKGWKAALKVRVIGQ
jgi:hypothetical protein